MNVFSCFLLVPLSTFATSKTKKEKIMRTKILLFLLILVSMVACTTDTTEEEHDLAEKTAKENYSTDVARTLKSFNDSIFTAGKGQLVWAQTKTRGRGGLFVVTATSDIFGAIRAYKACVGVAAFVTAVSGGTAGPATGVAVLGATALLAGGASYSAYKQAKGTCSYAITMDDYFSKLRNDKDLSDIMMKFKHECISTLIENKGASNLLCVEICEQTGDLHNELLNLLEAKETQSITRTAPGDMKKITEEKEQKSLKNNPYSIDVIGESDLMKIKNSITSDLSVYGESCDYTNALYKYKEDGCLTRNSGDIFSLFFEALYNSVVDKATLNDVVSKYESCVTSSSELSVEEKNILLVGLETARYSCSYWYDKGI